MNNSKGPKIVIAVGLVAVYAAGFSYVMLREKPVVEVAGQATMVPPAPLPAYESTYQSANEPLDSALPENSAGETAPSPALVADPAPVAPPVVAAPAKRVAAPAVEASNPPSEMASEMAGVESNPAEPAAAPVPADQPQAMPADNDSQITADVRAQIAAVAPAGDIDVSTRDGMVALTGSVPSEAEINRVWLAARNVPDVRSVDVSALMISN